MSSSVEVRDNNIEKALRTLKKRMNREQLYQEVKSRRFHEKPAEKRKREKLEAKRRIRKAESKRLAEMG